MVELKARSTLRHTSSHVGKKFNMAMLAEPKSKQKWSSDPRNTTWTNGKELFIYPKTISCW